VGCGRDVKGIREKRRRLRFERVGGWKKWDMG
jgi:hypothetical protein